MKKVFTVIFTSLMLTSCSNNTLCSKYLCETSNGEFGSVLHFKKGGELFLDLVTNDLVKRNPELASKINVPGDYEIADDKIIIKYFDGYQTHTLTKTDDKLTSTSDLFKSCTCKTK